MEFQQDPKGWDQLIKDIVDNEAVPAMQRVADRANLDLVASALRRGTVRGKARESSTARAEHITAVGKGFMVGTEGDESLEKHDYRATVITASAAAMNYNAAHHPLVRYFPLAYMGD